MSLKTQTKSSILREDLDNFSTTLYRIPALLSINEEVEDICDPVNLVNHEDLDDYLLSIKARHKPESKISVNYGTNTSISSSEP